MSMAELWNSYWQLITNSAPKPVVSCHLLLKQGTGVVHTENKQVKGQHLLSVCNFFWGRTVRPLLVPHPSPDQGRGYYRLVHLSWATVGLSTCWFWLCFVTRYMQHPGDGREEQVSLPALERGDLLRLRAPMLIQGSQWVPYIWQFNWNTGFLFSSPKNLLYILRPYLTFQLQWLYCYACLVSNKLCVCKTCLSCLFCPLKLAAVSGLLKGHVYQYQYR